MTISTTMLFWVIVGWLGGSTGTTILFILILIILDKAEEIKILYSLLCQVIKDMKFLGVVAKKAEKQYAKMSVEGRVNRFVKRSLSDFLGFSASKVKVNFINPDTNKKAFLDNKEVVVHLSRSKTDTENFVAAVHDFVSMSLLARVKRHISDTLKESLDLFVLDQILRGQKDSIYVEFAEKYTAGAVKHPKVSDYFDCYSELNKCGYFFTILIPQLDFIGTRVITLSKKHKVNAEVNGLLDFLTSFSNRRLGDVTVPSEFLSDNAKLAIVIIGKSWKVKEHGESPYVKYISNNLSNQDYDSLYILGDNEYKNTILETCRAIKSEFRSLKHYTTKGLVRFIDENSELQERKTKTFIAVCRSNEREN